MHIIFNIDNQYIYLATLINTYNVSRSSIYRIINIHNTDINISDNIYSIVIKNNRIEYILNNNKKTKISKTASHIEKSISSKDSDNNKHIYKKDIYDNNSNHIYIEVIDHLNKQSGKRYSPKSSQTKKLINARIKEGYNITDFKKVIDIKCTNWLNSPMEAYLRPETLFSNKFEGYVNEELKVIKDKVDKVNDTISQAKQFDWENHSQNA